MVFGVQLKDLQMMVIGGILALLGFVFLFIAMGMAKQRDDKDAENWRLLLGKLDKLISRIEENNNDDTKSNY